MIINVGHATYTIKIPMLIKAPLYMSSSILMGIFSSATLNPYHWAWPDWIKWVVIMAIQILVLVRAFKNRNKR